MKQKILSLLVLLIAASGAWAQTGRYVKVTEEPADWSGDYLIVYDSGSDVLAFNGGLETLDATFNYITVTVTNNAIVANATTNAAKFTVAAKTGGYSILSASGKYIGQTDYDNNLKTKTSDDFTNTFSLDGSGNAVITAIPTTGDNTILLFNANSNQMRFRYYKSEQEKIQLYKFTDAVDVTTTPENETYFTEASFAMPAYDATVEYELVRDMEDATYPVNFAGIPEPTGDATKLIVKKGSDGKFQFLNPMTIQLIDNISGSDVDIINADGITVKVLVGDDSNGPVEYDDENPITLDEFLADTQPGFYRIKAVPTDETSPYIGTVYSYDMWLINGYEVTIPAGEMITYFKDEPLRIDEADRESIELYTISSVSETTATLSGPYDALPKNTPMLVYNKDTENAKTTYLIPCNDPDLAVTVADEFVGTLEPTTIAASDDSQNNYAFNGKNFIWVKNDLEVGANKAWLELPGASSARSIVLVFSDVVTGLKAMDNGQLTMDNWYDLNGRKLNAMPTKKGVYIFNGKKVVK